MDIEECNNNKINSGRNINIDEVQETIKSNN